MCVNLNDYQFKTSRYNDISTDRNLMVTTKQKPSIDTQKLEQTEHKHMNK